MNVMLDSTRVYKPCVCDLTPAQLYLKLWSSLVIVVVIMADLVSFELQVETDGNDSVGKQMFVPDSYATCQQKSDTDSISHTTSETLYKSYTKGDKQQHNVLKTECETSMG